ncbi:MAG: hypothetical protein FWC50_08270 [Planctomycetaceae bacterium]|nr:hypothetical protein [Planctomycetaceae bacterium]
MRHRFFVTVCALLAIACCSGVLFSQSMRFSPGGSADPETQRLFFEDVQSTPEEFQQFRESLRPLIEDMQKNIQPKVMAAVMERVKNSATPPSPEELTKAGVSVVVDELTGLQKPISDNAKEFFSEERYQKMQKRLFQVQEGIMEHLGTTDDPETVRKAYGLNMMRMMAGPPDFLELSPEQKEQMTKLQKDGSVETMTLFRMTGRKMMTEHPEKQAEITRLTQEMDQAQTDEERKEIEKKIQELNADMVKDMMKDISPQLKKILVENRESYMRVLTDAQKAKIKAVMADMPDYMKKRLAESGKNGGQLGDLDSWVPGMGVPALPNSKREAPRQRPRGERTFPGNN